MKRFILVFVLAIVTIVSTARILAPVPCPRQPTMGQRILHFLAGWWVGRRIFREEPPGAEQEMPQTYEQLATEDPPVWRGDAMARQPVMRATSADGTPQLNHATGW